LALTVRIKDLDKLNKVKLGYVMLFWFQAQVNFKTAQAASKNDAHVNGQK